MALLEKRNEGRDEVITRDAHAGRLVLRTRTRLEELREVCLFAYAETSNVECNATNATIRTVRTVCMWWSTQSVQIGM